MIARVAGDCRLYDEAFDHFLDDDKSYSEESMYVSDEEKREIDDWYETMGLSRPKNLSRCKLVTNT